MNKSESLFFLKAIPIFFNKRNDRSAFDFFRKM